MPHDAAACYSFPHPPTPDPPTCMQAEARASCLRAAGCQRYAPSNEHPTHPLTHPLPSMQAEGVLPAGSWVSALVMGDLGASMPVPETPAYTVLP